MKYRLLTLLSCLFLFCVTVNAQTVTVTKEALDLNGNKITKLNKGDEFIYKITVNGMKKNDFDQKVLRDVISDKLEIISSDTPVKYKKVLLGDIDLSGTIASGDISEIQSYILEMADFSPLKLFLADVNRDGFINADDKLLIRAMVEGEKEKIEVMMPYVLAGDINLDGRVNVRDMSMMSSYLTDNYRLNTTQIMIGDLDNDGFIKDNDLTILSSYLADAASYSDYIVELPIVSVLLGDINGSKEVNAEDLTEIKRLLIDRVEYDRTRKILSNADTLGGVDSSDIAFIKQNIIQNPDCKPYILVALNKYILGYLKDQEANERELIWLLPSVDEDDKEIVYTVRVKAKETTEIENTAVLEYFDEDLYTVSANVKINTVQNNNNNNNGEKNVDNPNTGISLPLVALIALFISAIGLIIYSNKKKLIK